ncbi:protein required for attachment to host cells [Hoeflea sp. IMCC20628]|uniref:host attachment family protein n=1 Tax=Hoeflea sp. IMCC20628 TaxID=1620421 RepID=UPI00063AEDB5|nr:host attachment family protein [Hoeflea sp. IMCC20628]AKI00128.1 protein required for attachment to host cells [Hoeflea sp. IMCC20628]
MTHTPVPHKTLIVVGTGEGAKFYRNSGKSGELKLQHEHDLEPGNLADQGPAGKQAPDVSAKESMEATFAKILANHLYDLAQQHKFDHLILVLDPDTLGETRPSLHVSVTDKVMLELPKTLVNSPTDQIEKSILAAL